MGQSLFIGVGGDYMPLPKNEKHRTNNWILKAKRKIKGLGWLSQPIVTNFANFKCSGCGKIYTRIVSDQEYKELEVNFSRWIWGWVR